MPEQAAPRKVAPVVLAVGLPGVLLLLFASLLVAGGAEYIGALLCMLALFQLNGAALRSVAESGCRSRGVGRALHRLLGDRAALPHLATPCYWRYAAGRAHLRTGLVALPAVALWVALVVWVVSNTSIG